MSDFPWQGVVKSNRSQLPSALANSTFRSSLLFKSAGSAGRPRSGEPDAENLTTTLDYLPAADLRPKEIKHTRPGNVALSKHVYGHKPAGNIRSWAQTLGTGAAKTWVIAYDKADQLEAATRTQGETVTTQQAFGFDRIGNITRKQCIRVRYGVEITG
ncbi:MAG: hypothetical protein RLZZ505_841 [Verrucomicrobiota bacterium]|jgi:hypothetical protein